MGHQLIQRYAQMMGVPWVTERINQGLTHKVGPVRHQSVLAVQGLLDSYGSVVCVPWLGRS